MRMSACIQRRRVKESKDAKERTSEEGEKRKKRSSKRVSERGRESWATNATGRSQKGKRISTYAVSFFSFSCFALIFVIFFILIRLFFFFPLRYAPSVLKNCESFEFFVPLFAIPTNPRWAYRSRGWILSSNGSAHIQSKHQTSRFRITGIESR